MKTRTMMITISVLTAGLLLVACGGIEPQPDDSVESIQESLELEQTGGFTVLDELPGFGLPELDMVALDPNIEIPEAPLDMTAAAGVLPGKTGVVIKPACPHGLLKGKWKEIKSGYGVFKGKWASANGKVTGHLKGIYGKNLKGQGVLFGKYISASGKFKGLLKGRYGKHHFKAVWHGVNGGKGIIRGVYGQAKCVTLSSGVKKCLPGKGIFVGKWRAFCPKCLVKCAPGFVQPPNRCFCVPKKIVPCLKGKCPGGMYCDPCAMLPGCKSGRPCAAICAPPVCRPKPQPKPAAPQTNTDPNAAPGSNIQ